MLLKGKDSLRFGSAAIWKMFVVGDYSRSSVQILNAVSGEETHINVHLSDVVARPSLQNRAIHAAALWKGNTDSAFSVCRAGSQLESLTPTGLDTGKLLMSTTRVRMKQKSSCRQMSLSALGPSTIHW